MTQPPSAQNGCEACAGIRIEEGAFCSYCLGTGRTDEAALDTLEGALLRQRAMDEVIDIVGRWGKP